MARGGSPAKNWRSYHELVQRLMEVRGEPRLAVIEQVPWSDALRSTAFRRLERHSLAHSETFDDRR
jgi:hypothetical protein